MRQARKEEALSDMEAAALDLATQGVAVFPCNADKSPRTANGFKDATTDAETVKAWDWNAGGMIGAAVPEGRVVIDVDPRNGGTATLKQLRDLGRELPRTRVVRTAGGGFHYYLTVPEGMKLRSTLGPGIDVKRAGKGYVIAPPSKGYVELPGGSLQDAPDWLLEELVIDESERTTAEASEAKFFPWEAGTAYGLAALERELGRLATAPEGGRNDALNRAAFALAQLVAGGELSDQRAIEDLVLAAGRIGLGRDEAEKTIASGWKAGEQEPRQAPVRDSEVGAGGRVEAPKGEPDVLSGASPDALWIDWDVDEPEFPFYLHPILPKNAYVLVYGPTEAAKSMVWNALLAEASHRGIRSTAYSLENPAVTDRSRLRRLQPNKTNFRLTNASIDLNDARQLADLVEREREWRTDVIFIDTYSHAFNSRSEDGNARAIEFARRVRWIMAELGCSVVVVDHTGFDGDEPRDASAKRQQVDVAVLMKKKGEWQLGQPAGFTMWNRKAVRFGNPFFLTGEVRDVKHADGPDGLELAWIGEKPRWAGAT